MSGVLRLIQKNISMWELKSRYQDTTQLPGRFLHHGVSYGPCLLVSRECGSDGTEIACAVGKRLGWQVFDREIVDEVAQLAHVRQSLIESVDERARSTWEETWRPILAPEDVGSETYFRYLRQVVLALGHHGEVVIVGRGAHYLLPPECALRLRVVAPLEVRARKLAERDNISIEAARNQLRHCAAERQEFIRKFFRGDIHSVFSYDLVINSAELSVSAATEVVLTALQQKLGISLHETAEAKVLAGA